VVLGVDPKKKERTTLKFSTVKLLFESFRVFIHTQTATAYLSHITRATARGPWATARAGVFPANDGWTRRLRTVSFVWASRYKTALVLI